jgi:small-conductance mechanosensitive channel
VLDRLQNADPAWVLLVAAALPLVLIPLLRRLLPAGQRHRGGGAILFLGMSVVLSACALAIGGMVGSSPAGVLQVMSLLALVTGLIAVVALVVVDLVLARLGVHVPPILRDLLHVTVTVAIGMTLLRLEGLDLFSLVTTSAVLTAVIGLALQSTIADVFGGLGLQLDRTLGRGEWIEVGKYVGRILEIGWRSTRIVTKAGDTVFVPNSELVSGEVLNFSRPTGAHQVTVRIGFHYRHTPDEVRQVLVAAARDVPGVLERPGPTCGPADFGDSAVVYALRYWIGDFGDETAIDEAVRTRLWYAARAAGLEIPYPIRTLVVAPGTPEGVIATDGRPRHPSSTTA